MGKAQSTGNEIVSQAIIIAIGVGLLVVVVVAIVIYCGCFRFVLYQK